MKRVQLICIWCLLFIFINNGLVQGKDYADSSLATVSDKCIYTPGSAWAEYINKIDGYQIELPGAWSLDASQEGTVTRLSAYDGMAVIDIFAQPLMNISADEYLNYSNQPITRQEQGIKVVFQSRESINNLPAYQIAWQRPGIKNRINDLNLYREIDLVLPGTVYTFILKTDSGHWQQYSPVLDHVVQSFKTRVPEQPEEKQAPKAAPQDINLAGEKMSLKIPAAQMLFGIFNQKYFLPEGTAVFRKYEESLGYKFELFMTYMDFWQEFPQEIIDRASSEGRIVMLTWHPVLKDDNPRSTLIPAIINGDYDAYIRDSIRRMKAVGAPLFLRFGNEMNGDYTLWCGWHYAKDADLFVDAWRHIHRIIEQEGAGNVILVWNPNDRNYPDFKWNRPELYYPGSEYVDWVGLTCYNGGTAYPGDTWRSFNDMYRPVYNDYLIKYPGKPFMIGEFACNEDGGDKSAWIKECLSSLKNYPNIRIAVWFDKIEGQWLYSINSSPAAIDAFKQGIKDPYFLRNGVTRQQVLR